MGQRNTQRTLIIALAALLWSAHAGADSVDDAKKPATTPAASDTAVQPTASGAKVVADDPEGANPKVLRELEAFCIKWMGFLAVRERDNKQAVKWESGPAGVVGKFVGYGSDYECRLKAASGDAKAKKAAVPVATLTYREYLYQQEGPSQSEAKDTTPRTTEVTEVMEIFRYSGGKWVY